MHITQVDIYYLLPLVRVEFDCDERVNLFVGPNASGKSTILRAINGVYSLGLDRTADVGIDYIAHDFYTLTDEAMEVSGISLKASDDWPVIDDESITVDAVPLLYIPAARVHLPVMPIFDQLVPTIGEPENVKTDAPLKDLFDTKSGVFHGQYVELAIDWLRMYVKLGQQNQLRKVIEVGYSCAKSVCSEVIYDETPHHYVEWKEKGGSARVVHYNLGIGTTDDILGEPLYAGVLSSGTQGTLLWVWALALKMANHYDWTEGWEEKPAILLIDEIENHLHPTWQRRVIPALLEHFPGLQIFATTHSPFIVAGRKAGQVHLLNWDESGVITATTNTEDVIGWTADEILRTMLGVDDPTDEETAKNARELRQLRKEGPRDTPEKEEERQQKMEELRKLVDRDLLAGGPMAAQMELFEQQFAEALAQYRQSQSLNQENG